MDTLTFWLGLVASGEQNAFCMCGSETDRTARFGVHASDGAGRMRLACSTCSRRHAFDLARLGDIKAPHLRIGDLPAGRNAAKYELFAIEESIHCEELPCEDLPLKETPA